MRNELLNIRWYVARKQTKASELTGGIRIVFRFLSKKKRNVTQVGASLYREESQRPRLDEKLVYNFDHVPRTKRK